MDILSVSFIGVICIFGFAILYWKIRKFFSVKVNCWFCNKDCIVQYEKKNSFLCSYCDQYNGFLKDGGYNKIISAQYDELLNNRRYTSNFSPRYSVGNSNGFCLDCNRNQELKIQQLASFVPVNSARYDEEIEEYKKHLELTYDLCSRCKKTLNGVLTCQNSPLLNILRAWKNFRLKDGYQRSFSLRFYTSIVWITRCVVILLGTLLTVANGLYIADGWFVLPYVSSDDDDDVCPVPPRLLSIILAWKVCVIMLGTALQFCLTSFSKWRCVDILCSFSWILPLVYVRILPLIKSFNFVNETNLNFGHPVLSSAVFCWSIVTAFSSATRKSADSDNVWRQIHKDNSFIINWQYADNSSVPPRNNVGFEEQASDCSVKSPHMSSKKKTSVRKSKKLDVMSQDNDRNTESNVVEDLHARLHNLNIGGTDQKRSPKTSRPRNYLMLKPSILNKTVQQPQSGSAALSPWTGDGKWDKYSNYADIRTASSLRETEPLWDVATCSRSSSDSSSGYGTSYSDWRSPATGNISSPSSFRGKTFHQQSPVLYYVHTMFSPMSGLPFNFNQLSPPSPQGYVYQSAPFTTSPIRNNQQVIVERSYFWNTCYLLCTIVLYDLIKYEVLNLDYTLVKTYTSVCFEFIKECLERTFEF